MVGELILDWMLGGFFHHIYDGGITKQQFGSHVHAETKRKCQLYVPINGVSILCEPHFINSSSGPMKSNSKGSLSIDVIILYMGKPVIGFELKTGRGMSPGGIATRQKWMGGTIIQITLKPSKG
jgi:hypothetical protein